MNRNLQKSVAYKINNTKPSNDTLVQDYVPDKVSIAECSPSVDNAFKENYNVDREQYEHTFDRDVVRSDRIVVM